MPEYLDDFLFDDCRRTFVVAVVALRLVRLRYCRLFCMLDRPCRRHLPHLLSRREQGVLRDLGVIMACSQSCRDCLYMVRSAGVDWRYDCPLHHPMVARLLITDRQANV